MPSPKRAITSEVAAASIQGATVGIQVKGTVGVGEATLDLSDYPNRYIHLYCEDVDVYYCFMEDDTTVMTFATSLLPVVGVARRVDQGGAGKHEVVPDGARFLRYRAVSGANGSFIVTPS